MSRNSGGADQFEAFFRAQFPRILSIGYRITSSRQDAEDIAIETFARAYVSWSRVENAAWRDGWMVTVATNLALDLLRRRKVVEKVSERCQWNADNADETDQLVDRIWLVDALRSLPKRQRQVSVLIYGAGMSHGEASESLGLAAGTTKSHLHRATGALRGLLVHSDKEGDRR